MFQCFVNFRLIVLLLACGALLGNMPAPAHLTYLCRMSGQVSDECCCVSNACDALTTSTSTPTETTRADGDGALKDCCDRSQTGGENPARRSGFKNHALYADSCAINGGGCCDVNVAPAKAPLLIVVTSANDNELDFTPTANSMVEVGFDSKSFGVISQPSHQCTVRGSPPLFLVHQVFRL